MIESAGVVSALVLIGVIVAAESGLLIGLLLPGDTLLLVAGFFAAQGKLPLAWVLVIIFLAAILGDNIGYFFGEKTGPRMFRKKDGLFFRQEHVLRAQQFYERHGGKTVLFARFVPYVRTLTPLLAGAAKMNHAKFIVYNIIGALLWTVSFVMLGYGLGVEVAKQIERYIFPAFIVGLVFAFCPTLIHLARNKRLRQRVLSQLRQPWRRRR